MTHDPMHANALGDGDGCRVCGIIARVREDERELHGYRLHDSAYENGYAAGIAAAREAVAGLRPDDAEGSRIVTTTGAFWINSATALAAIDALTANAGTTANDSSDKRTIVPAGQTAAAEPGKTPDLAEQIAHAESCDG